MIGVSLRPVHSFLLCFYCCMVLGWSLSTVHASTGAWCWLVNWFHHTVAASFTLTIVSQPPCPYIQLSFTLIWTISGLETNYRRSKRTSSPCLDDFEYLKSRQSQHCHSTEQFILDLNCTVSSSLPTVAGVLQLEGSTALLPTVASGLVLSVCVLFNCNWCTLWDWGKLFCMILFIYWYVILVLA